MSYTLLVVLVLALSNSIGVATSMNETNPVEQLFLDIFVHDVVNGTDGIPTVDPWANKYVAAIHEKRFGDAVWPRYHRMGEVNNGIVGDTNSTVPESIEEDAMEYKANAPKQFADALSLYANTSSKDAHTDMLDVLSNANLKDVSILRIEPHTASSAAAAILPIGLAVTRFLTSCPKQRRTLEVGDWPIALVPAT